VRSWVLIVSSIAGTACASIGSHDRWAARVVAALSCGMSIADIQAHSQWRLESDVSPRGLGTHRFTNGGTDVWLKFGETGLDSVVVVSPRALKRVRISERQKLCTGERFHLARLYFPREFAGAQVVLNGVASARLSTSDSHLDFEVSAATAVEVGIKPLSGEALFTILSADLLNDDGLYELHVERSPPDQLSPDPSSSFRIVPRTP